MSRFRISVAIDWPGSMDSSRSLAVRACFSPDPRHNPAAYRGTRLEKILPVELGVEAPRAAGPERPTMLEPTPQGRSSPTLRLAAKEDENVVVWKRLQSIYWAARVTRAKPAAQILLQATDATRFGKMPVVALLQYGFGQVLYFGTDNTWPWWRNADERCYPILWGQIKQKLGLANLLCGSRRTQLSLDKKSYAVGKRVSVDARLYTPEFQPVKDNTVEGVTS